MPDPWFYVFIMAWTTIIIIAPQKILYYKILNYPSPKATQNNLIKEQSDWVNDWS